MTKALWGAMTENSFSRDLTELASISNMSQAGHPDTVT